MSTLLIRSAIEAALDEMQPPLSTAWENVAFSPVGGEPYQRVWFPAFLPENPTIGSGYSRVRGYVQIDLMYPPGEGSGDIGGRAELIKSIFHRGAAFPAGDVTVNIDADAAISGGMLDGDRWKVVVKFRYYAEIFG